MLWMSRDYVVTNYAEGFTSLAPENTVVYLMSIFLYRIMGWTIVGKTSLPIDTSYVIASGVGVGQRAGINYGTGKEYQVGIPIARHTVSATYVNHILVLKSTANPRHNCGLFKIVGINATDNRYIIDWRSTEFPPAEADDSFDWWLYEEDKAVDGLFWGYSSGNISTGNGTPGPYTYRAKGSTNSRIIFQSPHSTGWQLRLCCEVDAFLGTLYWYPTASIGFDGDSAGDFQFGGRHTHVANWFNVKGDHYTGPYAYANSIPTDRNSARYTFIADDGGRAFVAILKNRSNGYVGHLVCGIPDDEPSPIPSDPLYRVFCIGSKNEPGASTTTFSATDEIHGTAFGYFGSPINCWYSTWVSFNASYTAFGYASAGDNPRTGVTDLVSVQIVAGQFPQWYWQGAYAIQMEPRVLGFVPIIRQGRSNFAAWTTTTDKTWLHLQNGAFVPYGGPTPMP